MKITPYNLELEKHIETIYNAHAPKMYGCIYNIVQNELFAAEILSKTFEEICNNYAEIKTQETKSIWYIKLAMKKTFTFLKMQDLTSENFSYINERIVALQKNIASPVLAQA
jgi:CRISPR/Cas system-associated endoribonuclease Cas2